jgi:hypothetical protein
MMVLTSTALLRVERRSASCGRPFSSFLGFNGGRLPPLFSAVLVRRERLRPVVKLRCSVIVIILLVCTICSPSIYCHNIHDSLPSHLRCLLPPLPLLTPRLTIVYS